jgi:hypothetical protein
MNVLIGTPAYGGMVHLDYLKSLLEYQRHGLPFSLASFGNESLITRARNSIISYFYQQPEFTHLLFLDADIRLPAADLRKLMDYGVDVIAAAVPVKAYDKDGNVRLNSSALHDEVAKNLYKTRYASTAALLLSRKAVVDVVEKAKAEGRTYQFPQGLDSTESLAGLTMYDVFQVGVVDGEYLSEDFWLCKELGELGYDIYISDAVTVIHHGMHGFKAKKSP